MKKNMKNVHKKKKILFKFSLYNSYTNQLTEKFMYDIDKNITLSLNDSRRATTP